jgi:hypothetical protein
MLTEMLTVCNITVQYITWIFYAQQASEMYVASLDAL